MIPTDAGRAPAAAAAAPGGRADHPAAAGDAADRAGRRASARCCAGAERAGRHAARRRAGLVAGRAALGPRARLRGAGAAVRLPVAGRRAPRDRRCTRWSRRPATSARAGRPWCSGCVLPGLRTARPRRRVPHPRAGARRVHDRAAAAVRDRSRSGSSRSRGADGQVASRSRSSASVSPGCCCSPSRPSAGAAAGHHSGVVHDHAPPSPTLRRRSQPLRRSVRGRRGRVRAPATALRRRPRAGRPRPDASRPASWSRCSARPAAARPPRCGCWPASRPRTRARCWSTATDITGVPAEQAATWAWSSRPTACSRTSTGRQRGVRAAGARRRRRRAPGAGRHELLELVGLADARRAATRTSCPAASSSGSRWPGRWPSSRGCCCWTSRSPRWTPRCGCSCGTRSAGCSSSSASPRCSSRTTRRRRCRSPTGSAVLRDGQAGAVRHARTSSTTGRPPRSWRSSSAR